MTKDQIHILMKDGDLSHLVEPGWNKTASVVRLNNDHYLLSSVLHNIIQHLFEWHYENAYKTTLKFFETRINSRIEGKKIDEKISFLKKERNKYKNRKELMNIPQGVELNNLSTFWKSYIYNNDVEQIIECLKFKVFLGERIVLFDLDRKEALYPALQQRLGLLDPFFHTAEMFKVYASMLVFNKIKYVKKKLSKIEKADVKLPVSEIATTNENPEGNLPVSEIAITKKNPTAATLAITFFVNDMDVTYPIDVQDVVDQLKISDITLTRTLKKNVVEMRAHFKDWPAILTTKPHPNSIIERIKSLEFALDYPGDKKTEISDAITTLKEK